MKFKSTKTGVLFMTGMLLISIAFNSCRKDEKTDAVEPSQKEKLIGDWLITGLLLDPPMLMGNDVVSNYFNLLEDCYLDDYYSFQSNNQFTLHLNDTECYPQQTELAGNWTFNSDQTRLILIDKISANQSENLIEYYIDQLTSKRLILIYTTTQPTYQNYIYIFTKK